MCKRAVNPDQQFAVCKRGYTATQIEQKSQHWWKLQVVCFLKSGHILTTIDYPGVPHTIAKITICDCWMPASNYHPHLYYKLLWCTAIAEVLSLVTSTYYYTWCSFCALLSVCLSVCLSLSLNTWSCGVATDNDIWLQNSRPNSQFGYKIFIA